MNFYRRFLRNAAHEQSILSDYLKGAKKNDNRPIIWTEEAKIAFEKCKVSLSETTMLVHPSQDAELSLTCDSSDRAIGSVLSQKEGDEFKPLAFFSCKLVPSEQRYSVYDRELLAIYASIPGMETELFWDVSEGRCRPYVPPDFRHKIFMTLHELSLPGPNYKREVAEWSRCCVACQKSKVQRHVVSSPGTYPLPRQQFNHIHIDLVGPLPPSRGYTYCLTCVDRFSRWPEVIPLRDIKAETVAFEFFPSWIARFGVPERLTTDQGRQFESNLFREFASLLGIKLVHTTLCHPQSNGMVGRLHRQLKSAIRAYSTDRWTLVLPSILLGIRASMDGAFNRNKIMNIPLEKILDTPLDLTSAF
ncbi:protein NYNRIN-like [Parasteatoda tepidariorum]|uniref:protein NYNRIN-like n=1 Tax=Parasteatoda tepidariorum TaxID=114398 RepID=UPI0039BD62AA